MNFKAVFRNMVEFFEKQRIDYALIGAFAMKAYGYVRATQDVDFISRRMHQEVIVGFLESLGYETLHRSKGFSNHLHSLAGLGRIDFLYIEGETADLLLSGAKPVLLLGDLTVPVVRAEHLAALKAFAMKNDPERSFREMDDLHYLLNLPGFDLEEVRGYFERYGQLEKYHELTRARRTES